MNRRTFVAMFGAAVLAQPVSARRPLRIGVDTFGVRLDPYIGAAPETDEYAWIYGDGLTTGEPAPRGMLAEIPEVRDNGLTVRYRLRSVRWHDDVALRASHVAEALEALRRAESPWLTFEPYSLIRDLATRDRNSIDIRLHRPAPSFARKFFSPYTHPALPLLRHDADGLPVGTGPFRLQRADADRWAFAAWRGSPRGAPASAALDVRLRPSHDELANEIAAGQIDLAIPIVQDKPISDSYRIVSRDLSTIVMVFNCAGAFHTPALRQAVLRALDFDVLRRTIDPHAEEAVRGVLPAGTRDDVPFPYPPHDLARARAELAKVGTPVTMIYLAEIRRYQTLVLEIRQMLGAAGVELLPAPRPKLGYFAPEGALRTGRFDIAIGGFAYDDHPDLGADWSCVTAAPAGANYARFCDPRFDAALARGRDRDALRQLFDAVPLAPLARNSERFGVARNVVGFEAPPRFVPPTLTVQRWAVPGETT